MSFTSSVHLDMAPLASISETNAVSPSARPVRPANHRAASFERLRPRSRVLVVSRRPTRVRNPSRHLHGPSGQSSQRPPALRRLNKPDKPPENTIPSSTDAKNPPCNRAAPPPPRVEVASSAAETSVSSVDLDSFPLPPSSNISWHRSRAPSRSGPENPSSSRRLQNAPAPGRSDVIFPRQGRRRIWRAAMLGRRRCRGRQGSKAHIGGFHACRGHLEKHRPATPSLFGNQAWRCAVEQVVQVRLAACVAARFAIYQLEPAGRAGSLHQKPSKVRGQH